MNDASIRVSGPFPYMSPARRCDEPEYDGRAHGCVTYVDKCGRTGATRRRNVNGPYVETGRWTAARGDC